MTSTGKVNIFIFSNNRRKWRYSVSVYKLQLVVNDNHELYILHSIFWLIKFSVIPLINYNFNS